MATMAKWNAKSFVVNQNKIVALSGFSTTYQIKSDTNSDTSGTSQTNTRGRAAEEPGFTVDYLAAAGSNPRQAMKDWRNLVGVEDYLYIGGQQYGNNKFQLISAAVSDVLMDIKGNIVKASIALKFKEVMPVPKKPAVTTTATKAAASKSTSGTTASTTTTSKSPLTKASQAQAKAAQAATKDKALKSPYTVGTRMPR